jgi:hypothetical protein
MARQHAFPRNPTKLTKRALSELKPGKKGLALKPDQFAALLAFGESIQAATAAAATVKK